MARSGVVLLLALATVLIAASTASAASQYRYWTSFGADLLGDQAADIVVDNSSGPSAHDLYVADTQNHRVVRFGPDGQFVLMFGDEVDATTGGDVCTEASGHICQAGKPSIHEIPAGVPSPGFAAISELAIGGGPLSSGDVYVYDQAHERVVRFDSAGNRREDWADEGELQLHWVVGIAVDAAERLLVLEGGEHGTVRVFDESATEIEAVPISPGTYPQGLEVDRSGHLYVIEVYGQITEFTAAGSRVRGFDLGEGGNDYSVDGSTGDLLVTRGDLGLRIFSGGCAADPCSTSRAFGRDYVWAGRPAIDEGDKRIFVTDYAAPGGATVAVFLPATEIPETTTWQATVRGEEEADLLGVVDPAGAPVVVECRFEYVTEAEYAGARFAGARSRECRESVPISAATDVSTRLTGLEQGTDYRFRLVVRTATRTSVGLPGRFTTPILPEAETGAVRAVGSESATISGTVVSPRNRVVFKCVFEFVDESTFASSGFGSPITVPCDPRPFYGDDQEVRVEAEAKALAAATNYRYRLTAVNGDGSTHGATRAFTTTPRTIEAPEPPERKVRRRPRPHPDAPKVPCSKRPCSKLLSASGQARTWVSPRFPRTYGWVFDMYADGEALHHTELENGCASTFSGHGFIARLNGCRGRIRIVYRGPGDLRVRWRVFGRCRCGEARPSVARTALGP